jgi:hypothetical protein
MELTLSEFDIDLLRNRLDQFISFLNLADELARFEIDVCSTGACDFVVSLYPSNSLLMLLTALRARDSERLGIED